MWDYLDGHSPYGFVWTPVMWHCWVKLLAGACKLARSPGQPTARELGASDTPLSSGLGRDEWTWEVTARGPMRRWGSNDCEACQFWGMGGHHFVSAKFWSLSTGANFQALRFEEVGGYPRFLFWWQTTGFSWFASPTFTDGFGATQPLAIAQGHHQPTHEAPSKPPISQMRQVGDLARACWSAQPCHH